MAASTIMSGNSSRERAPSPPPSVPSISVPNKDDSNIDDDSWMNKAASRFFGSSAQKSKKGGKADGASLPSKDETATTTMNTSFTPGPGKGSILLTVEEMTAYIMETDDEEEPEQPEVGDKQEQQPETTRMQGREKAFLVPKDITADVSDDNNKGHKRRKLSGSFHEGGERVRVLGNASKLMVAD